MKIIKNFIYITLISIIPFNPILADDFNSWVISFKSYALNKGISKKTLDETMS